MTKDRSAKRAARTRKATTGEPYIRARRLTEPDEHNVFARAPSPVAWPADLRTAVRAHREPASDARQERSGRVG